MSTTTLQRIQQNYTAGGMADRMREALERAGLGTGPLHWSDLVPFDQFHVRGLEASQELAKELQLATGQRVLDVGSGLGGPARYLAAAYGVHVTGIDLTASYVEISNYLSERAGMTDKLIFQQGDATELPFSDESFDVAWTQHVAMNIQDKAKLYKSVQRVLKRGSKFAIYDAIEGNGEPVLYPTPWAREEGLSFLATESEMRDELAEAGFTNLLATDKTDISAQWFRELQQRQQSQTVTAALSPLFIFGPEMRPAIGNFARNVLEGRVRVMQMIADRL